MRLTRPIAIIRPLCFRDALHGFTERQNRKNSFDYLIMRGLGLACSVHGPQQQRQIACRRLDEQFLVDITNAPDIEPVHATGIELMREVPFDFLSALPLQPLASFSPDAPPV